MTISIIQVQEEKKEYNRIFDDVKPLLEMVFCSISYIYVKIKILSFLINENFFTTLMFSSGNGCTSKARCVILLGMCITNRIMKKTHFP